MKKFCLLLVLSLLCAFPLSATASSSLQTIYDTVIKNLNRLIVATEKIKVDIATDLAAFRFITRNVPSIELTPESIIINSDGSVNISNARELIIRWMDGTNQVFGVAATAVNDLVTYKKKEPVPFGLGLASAFGLRTETDGTTSVEPYIGLGISYHLFWNINLYVAVGYPGIFGGFSYNMTKTFDIIVGTMIHYKGSAYLSVGVNSKLW